MWRCRGFFICPYHIHGVGNLQSVRVDREVEQLVLFTNEYVAAPCSCLLTYLVLPTSARVWAPGTRHTSWASCARVRGVCVLRRQRAL